MDHDDHTPDIRLPQRQSYWWLAVLIPSTVLGTTFLVVVGVAILIVAFVVILIFAIVAAVNAPVDKLKFNLDRRFNVVELEHRGRVSALAFSPDGKHLAAGSIGAAGGGGIDMQGQLSVWEVETTKEIRTMVFPQWIASLAFHPDGKTLAVSCSTNRQVSHEDAVHIQGQAPKSAEVHLFDFPAMNAVKMWKFDGAAGQVRFSPDGRTLAVASEGRLTLFDFPKLTERAVTKEVDGLTPIAFTPDSTEIYATINRAPLQAVNRWDNAQLAIFHAGDGKFQAEFDRKKVAPGVSEVTRDGILVIGANYFDPINARFLDHKGKLIQAAVFEERVGDLTSTSHAPNHKHMLATTAKPFGHRAHEKRQSAVFLEDFDKKELIKVFHDTNVHYGRCAASPDAKTFAVGTDPTPGIHGKAGDPRRGRVLLFELRNP